MANKRVSTLAYLFIALYSVAAIAVSLNRFWQYEVFYYDFGIFDQAIWNVAHFRPPVIDHFVIPGKIIFADHFNPSLFLLTPLYWLTSRPEALLVAQVLAVGLSAVFVFLTGKRLIRHTFAALSVTVAYLLFIGTQNALISDIHEVTFMMLPLSIVFYALAFKRKRLFWISFLITLGFKESSALLGVGLSILIYFWNRSWRRDALVVAAISVAWGLLATQWVIPYFYGRRYFYTPSISSDPFALLSGFVDDPIKRHTLAISMVSFGFLPLLTPVIWPLIIQDFAARFLQHEFPLRWGLGLHYGTQLAVILAFSSVTTIAILIRKYGNRPVLTVILPAILIGGSVMLHQFKLHGPLGLAYNPVFYAHTKEFAFLDDLVARVPKGTTVMTQNNIAPHLIHTNTVYLLRAVYDDFLPDYFVLDLRDGQNMNDFFGANIEAVKLTLFHDPRYEVYYQNGDQMIYRRVGVTSP